MCRFLPCSIALLKVHASATDKGFMGPQASLSGWDWLHVRVRESTNHLARGRKPHLRNLYGAGGLPGAVQPQHNFPLSFDLSAPAIRFDELTQQRILRVRGGKPCARQAR